MPESQGEYWARRAKEHMQLAAESPHRAAIAAHTALARAYQQRAEEGKTAARG
jgi:hypothetical protein